MEADGVRVGRRGARWQHMPDGKALQGDAFTDLLKQFVHRKMTMGHRVWSFLFKGKGGRCGDNTVLPAYPALENGPAWGAAHDERGAPCAVLYSCAFCSSVHSSR